MKKSTRFQAFFLTVALLFLERAGAHTKIKIVGVDSALWNEISIPKTWVYTDCQNSFAEYPPFVEPTIHYCLHFTDKNGDRLELRFSRFQGKIDETAILFNLTNFSRTSLKIRK